MIKMKMIPFRFKKTNEIEFRRRKAFSFSFLAGFPGLKEFFVVLKSIKTILKVWKARIIMDRFKLGDLDDTNLKSNDPYTLS